MNQRLHDMALHRMLLNVNVSLEKINKKWKKTNKNKKTAWYYIITLSWIFTVRGSTCRPTHTYYPDSEPCIINLCSYSLMLRVGRSSSKYLFYSLWFDTTAIPRSTTVEGSTPTITPPMR